MQENVFNRPRPRRKCGSPESGKKADLPPELSCAPPTLDNLGMTSHPQTRHRLAPNLWPKSGPGFIKPVGWNFLYLLLNGRRLTLRAATSCRPETLLHRCPIELVKSLSNGLFCLYG